MNWIGILTEKKMYSKKVLLFVYVVFILSLVFSPVGCKKTDPPPVSDELDDTTSIAQSTDTLKNESYSRFVETLDMTYDEIIGKQISSFSKPRFSKLVTGESRYLTESNDGLVSIELYGTLTNVNKITIRFGVSTSELEQYAILLTVNPILENVLSASRSYINKWHEDTMTKVAEEITYRDVATIYDYVNGRSIEYKIWKTIGMILITIN